MTFQIIIPNNIKKKIKKIPKQHQEKLIRKLSQLSEFPYSGKPVKRLAKEDLKAIKKSEEEIRKGKYRTIEQLKRQLGLE